ncbi:MAG: hypothetical protein JKX84_09465 [Flavobacteriales bacterium]|nr:hypothetical protein [Flavobacteriales bacterium]
MKQALFLLILILGLSGCSNKLYESNWKNSKTETSTFRFYNPDSKIRYNIENDSENLYFSFDVMDNLTVQKILITGLRLFIDGTGKRKEKDELQFPIFSDKIPIDEFREYARKYEQNRVLGKHKLNELIPADGYIKLGDEVTPIFNHVEKNGVLVTMEFDSTGSLVYRATIPLKMLEAPSDPIAIGFETGGFELPRNDQNVAGADVTGANQGLSAGDRAMGRGNPNNPYGNNAPGRSTAAGLALRSSTSYNKVTEPIRFWVRTKLGSVQ